MSNPARIPAIVPGTPSAVGLVGGSSWFLKSDVGSAVAGALFKYAFPSYPGSYGMVAVNSFLISVLAHVIPPRVSTQTSVTIVSLTDSQKSEILVAIMGAIYAAVYKRNIALGIVGQTAIDLLGAELVNVLGMADSDLLQPSNP